MNIVSEISTTYLHCLINQLTKIMYLHFRLLYINTIMGRHCVCFIIVRDAVKFNVVSVTDSSMAMLVKLDK